MRPPIIPLNQNSSQSEVVFSREQEEKNLYNSEDLVELFPFGVSIANEIQRPFLLLKDKKEELTLPVAINPLEAGVTLTQSSQQLIPTTPHKFAELLLESLDIKIEKCIFSEIKGHYQYVRLYLENHPRYGSLRLRADEAMSLCLHMKTPIFATRAFIQKSKVMSAEIEGLSKGLEGHRALFANHHPYLM